MRNPFIWNEIEHWTGNDLIETIQLLDEDDAEDFMEAYTAVCENEEHAIHNVRYIFGLVDKETAEELSERFMLDLPESDEVLSPRQWFAHGSSLGLKEAV